MLDRGRAKVSCYSSSSENSKRPEALRRDEEFHLRIARIRVMRSLSACWKASTAGFTSCAGSTCVGTRSWTWWPISASRSCSESASRGVPDGRHCR